MQSARIVLWFVVRNLFRPGRIAATVISSLAIMLLTLIALLGLGVLYGHRGVERARLERDPLTQCLWLGHPAYRESWFTEERLAKLAEVLKTIPAVKEWYPCRELRLDWFLLREPPSDDSLSLPGRTFLPEDPIGRIVRRGPTESAEPGVYITPEFLTTLGHKEGDPVPTEVVFRDSVGNPRKTKICGILDRELPWQHRFLVEERWFVEHLQARPDVQAVRIQTGPLPAHWPREWEEFPEIVRTAFDQYGMLPPMWVEDEAERFVWDIRTWSHGGILLSQWFVCLQQVVTQMEGQGYSVTPPEKEQFLQIEALETLGADSEEATPYHFVVLYVPELGRLKEVKAELERAGFIVRDPAHTIHRLDELGKRTATLSRVLGGILGLLGTSLFAMLASLQAMRTEVRRQEIALLKALGMSSSLAAAVLLGEATFVWAYSSGIGWGIAWPLGRFVIGPSLVANEPEFASISFVIPVPMLITVMLLILLLSLTTVLSAAWKAFVMPPMRHVTA